MHWKLQYVYASFGRSGRWLFWNYSIPCNFICVRCFGRIPCDSRGSSTSYCGVSQLANQISNWTKVKFIRNHRVAIVGLTLWNRNRFFLSKHLKAILKSTDNYKRKKNETLNIQEVQKGISAKVCGRTLSSTLDIKPCYWSKFGEDVLCVMRKCGQLWWTRQTISWAWRLWPAR